VASRPTDAEALAASQVVGRLWVALADNDDETAFELTTEAVHDELGGVPGLAENLRDGFGVDRMLAARIGVSSKVRVIDGVMVFMCLEVDPKQGYKIVGDWGPVQVRGWGLYVAREGGEWRVDGLYRVSPDGWPDGTVYIDLPHAPSSGQPTHQPVAPVDPHPLITEAAGGLYRGGYYAQAVFEAFKAIEVRVRLMTGIDEVGAKLMSQAFGGEQPRYSLTERSKTIGRDEQEGRTLMLMGAMRAVRNLAGHELEGMEQTTAVELLGLASQMMRWLDDGRQIL
jgi:uncharacterized protein (TIGR02391 family)